MPETISPTAEPVAAATPAMAPEANGTATAAQVSQPESTNGDKGGPELENFTSVDPKTLPPQLKSAYDNMLRDYKSKTATLAEQRRSFESASKKAELYDQVSSDPAFVEYWNGLSNKQKAETINEANVNGNNLQISQEEFAKAFESPENFMSLVDKVAAHKMAGVTKKTQAMEAELTVSKANEFIKDFKSREEFKDFGKYEKFITLQLQANPNVSSDPKVWERSLREAYANADKEYKEIYEEGRKAALARIEEKAKYSTESPSNGMAQVYPGGDPKKLSASEAVALARKGIKVPKG